MIATSYSRSSTDGVKTTILVYSTPYSSIERATNAKGLDQLTIKLISSMLRSRTIKANIGQTFASIKASIF